LLKDIHGKFEGNAGQPILLYFSSTFVPGHGFKFTYSFKNSVNSTLKMDSSVKIGQCTVFSSFDYSAGKLGGVKRRGRAWRRKRHEKSKSLKKLPKRKVLDWSLNAKARSPAG